MYKPQFFVKEVGKNGQWTLQLHLDIQFTHWTVMQEMCTT